VTLYIHDDWPKGEIPKGRYAQEQRSPIVWVLLCAGCAGFAPFTTEDYRGYLTGHCGGCGMNSRELHRFCAYIDSASGCSCERHGDPMVGDLAAGPIQSSERGSNAAPSPGALAASERTRSRPGEPEGEG
jgi:hypothetical protein